MGDNGATAGAAEQTKGGFALSQLIRYQKPMFRVVLAAAPAMAAGVYFFGWRTLFLVAVTVVVAAFCEWLFTRKRGEPVTSAVFVTAVLYALSMPPRTPLLPLIVGIVVAVMFGKEVFGGYARNVFNPALVGRCFVYVCFPVAMTAEWLEPYARFPGGLAAWGQGADAFTRATPLYLYKTGQGVASLSDLFFGSVGGCIGETSAAMIIIGGVYLLWTKTANWRITVSVLVGAVLAAAAFHYGGAETVPGPLFTLLSGGLLFGAVFMATDPISAAQTNEGRYVYGFMVGVLIVIIRGFSSFPGGVMFAILLMNMFNPLIDHSVRELKAWRAAKGKHPATEREGAG